MFKTNIIFVILENMKKPETNQPLKNVPETVEYPFSIIQSLGLYSTTKSKRVVFLASIYLSCPVFLIIVNLIQFMGIKGNISEFVANLSELVSFGQVSTINIHYKKLVSYKRHLHNFISRLLNERMC